MSVPFLDLNRGKEAFESEFRKLLDEILESGIFVLGPKTIELEEKLAARMGAKHAIACSSGTDGLMLALLACGIGSGDEVITTPFSFFASTSTIVRAGAKPVFADIEADSLNIDPELIEDKITDKTRAILAVHLYGNPCNLSAITGIAEKRGLMVIEDAAQAIGARDGDGPVGARGDAGVLSFYPTKNLSAMGDAGMVLTSDEEKASLMRRLRIHGSGAGAYIHEIIGLNARIDAFQSASLLAKLPLLDKWTEARIRHAKAYNMAFEELPLETPRPDSSSEHVYHLYTVQTRRRDALKAFLTERGIGCGVYYPLPLHLQPCFSFLGYTEGDYPESERAAREVLSLPCYPQLNDSEREEVITCVKDFFTAKGGNE